MEKAKILALQYLYMVSCINIRIIIYIIFNTFVNLNNNVIYMGHRILCYNYIITIKSVFLGLVKTSKVFTNSFTNIFQSFIKII